MNALIGNLWLPAKKWPLTNMAQLHSWASFPLCIFLLGKQTHSFQANGQSASHTQWPLLILTPGADIPGHCSAYLVHYCSFRGMKDAGRKAISGGEKYLSLAHHAPFPIRSNIIQNNCSLLGYLAIFITPGAEDSTLISAGKYCAGSDEHPSPRYDCKRITAGAAVSGTLVNNSWTCFIHKKEINIMLPPPFTACQPVR